MGEASVKKSKGRRKFTPYEALYYKRIEVMLLVGIYLGRLDQGGTMSEAITALGERLGELYDNAERKRLTNAANTALQEIRCLLKDMHDTGANA